MAVFLFILFLLMVIYWHRIEYYRKAWNGIPIFLSTGNMPRTFISLIIPVRNESENLKPLFDSLYLQDYPKDLFEVIVIDDESTDNTWELLKQIDPNGMSFKYLRRDKLARDFHQISTKKKAIETGINSARGPLIVTTDADCIFHPGWLRTIAAFYEENNSKVIAAPVKIEPAISILAIFQTLDFLSLQGITGASVYRRFHSMCNGANLAYEKTAFFDVNGFDGIDNITSGDDMLLMHKIYKRYPEGIFYLKSPQATVITAPAKNWKEFIHQRIRWASKADVYDDKRIIWILLLVFTINAGFFFIGIVALWKGIWVVFLLLLLIAKIIIEFPFVQSVAFFFGQQRLMKYFPFLQPLHIVYIVVTGILGKFGSYEWKGRKIKRTQYHKQ